MTTIFYVEFETRHFTFSLALLDKGTTVTDELRERINAALRKAICRHAKQYQMSLNDRNQLLSYLDDDVNILAMQPGTVYRDWEKIPG